MWAANAPQAAELTFHGELGLHLVQFVLKHNTENPIRKWPAEMLSRDLIKTQEVSQQDVWTRQGIRKERQH